MSINNNPSPLNPKSKFQKSTPAPLSSNPNQQDTVSQPNVLVPPKATPPKAVPDVSTQLPSVQPSPAPAPLPSPVEQKSFVPPQGKPIETVMPSVPPLPMPSQSMPSQTVVSSPSPVPSPVASPNPVRDFITNQLPKLSGNLDGLLAALSQMSPELLKEMLKDPAIQAQLKSLAQSALDALLSKVFTAEELAAIKNYMDIARQMAGGNGYLGMEDVDKIARAVSDPQFMAALLRSGLFDDELVRPGIRGTRRGDRRGARRADFIAGRLERRPNGIIANIGGRIVYNLTRKELAAVLAQMGVQVGPNFVQDDTMLQLDANQIIQAIKDAERMKALAARMQAEMDALKAKLAQAGIDLSGLGIDPNGIKFPNGIPIPPSLQSILDAALNGRPLPPPLNDPGKLMDSVQVPGLKEKIQNKLPPIPAPSSSPGRVP